jgi:monoterpene epsilon-lactone hydrolase
MWRGPRIKTTSNSGERIVKDIASDVVGTVHVPARDVPIPSSLSAQAQDQMTRPSMVGLPYPTTSERAAWVAYAAAMDSAVLQMMRPLAASIDARVEEITIGEARVFVITPQVMRVDSQLVYLDIHGGGLVMGGGELCRVFGKATAARVGATVWTVDYRMPPDHPYPAALDDCIAAYRALLKIYQPEKIIVGGGSAGGNLAAATILRARDEDLPLPSAAFLGTPELDLTESGDSFRANMGLDARLTESLMPANLLYAAGHALTHPYLSPLFGDFSKGFPPTFLTSGTRDLFLSNAVRMHWALRAQGIPAELFIDEAGSHGGFAGCPESEQMLREVNRFLSEHWGRTT